MKITVDTNILVSSSFWYCNSDKIIEMVESGKIELILSQDIIEEFVRVLGYDEIKDKVREKELEMRRSVEKLISISTIVFPSNTIDIMKDDQKDNIILECAAEGMADYIISYDKHLLKLREFEGIKIMTPEEFLNSVGLF